MTALRVVQWATGNIGTRSLQGVIDHPAMDLAGVWVHGAEKVGRDAGELCGRPATGVLTTNDLDAIVGHLFGLGLPFEVLEPPELRDRLAEVAGDALARHGRRGMLRS